MTSPSDQLRATVAKLAAIAQAVRDAAEASRQLAADRAAAEATEREGAAGERPGPTNQAQG